MSRLFIAVWPPAAVVDALRSLPRKDQRGVRFVRPENWHVTLRFFGEADADAVADALEGVPLEPASARVGPGVDVLSERALVLPVHGLDDLAVTVATHTGTIGVAPRRRFIGHLTIARLKRHARMPPAIGATFQARFEVGEIALVQSRLDPAGARYITIATWPVG
jgi:2'-5' RNA ligase